MPIDLQTFFNHPHLSMISFTGGTKADPAIAAAKQRYINTIQDEFTGVFTAAQRAGELAEDMATEIEQVRISAAL